MGKGNFRLISEGILREILRKRQLLERFLDYYIDSCQGKKKSLRNEANRHSVSIELEMYDTRTVEDRRRKVREQKRCEKNLGNAMEWGLKNFREELSEKFIKEMGHRVEPETNNRNYRELRVRVSGSVWSPPAPEKLDREMAIFVHENNSCLDNVIARALHAHFHIARIHPFLDGNGRTARAVQNVILENNCFIPPIVRDSDRMEYLHLMDSAVNSYKLAEGDLNNEYIERLNEFYESIKGENISPKKRAYQKSLALKFAKVKMTREQGDFYNFMALKIRDILNREAEKLYRKSKGKK